MYQRIIKNDLAFFSLKFVSLLISAHTISFICPYILGCETCKVNYTGEIKSLVGIFLLTVIVGPLLETALFQFLPIEGYFKYFRNKSYNRKLPIIIATAVVFGLSHSYNILTILDATIAGFIFASIYVYFMKKNKSGFFFTFLIHASYNFYAFIINDILHW